jgi:PAS domain S-box-containing protein
MSTAEALSATLEPAFREGEARFRAVVEALPAPVYTTDPNGRLTFYNDAAANLWGRRPQLSTTYWCGSWRLYWPDGTFLPHDQSPVAQALKERRPIRGLEAVAERPDGTRVPFMPYPTPMFDNDGELIGLVNMLIDTEDRKNAETALIRQLSHFEALNRIGKILTTERELERIVQAATDSATELSGARFGAFFYNVTDAKGERYLLYTLSGAPGEAFEKLGLPRNTVVFDPTFRGTGIVRSDDIRKDPRYGHAAPHYGMPKRHLPVVSYLAVPVVSRTGEVHGGLFFGHEQAGVFTQESEGIVQAIASHAAVALDNANLHRASQRELDARRRAEAALARKVAEQTTLYALTDRLQGSTSRAEMYEAALDAIGPALGCDRASILLLDTACVMRFVAWRGLSAPYRAAVEGHSPWPADVQDPQPVCIEDVSRADLPDELRAMVTEEGIAGLSFIPLVSGRKLIGKFMTYYGGPHSFTEDETAVAVLIARQLAFNLGRVDAEDAVLAKEAELELVMSSTPFMMVRCNRDLQYRFASPAYAEMVGGNASSFVGRSVGEVIGERNLAMLRPDIERVLRGERVEWQRELHFEGAGERILRGVYLPERDAHGHVAGWIASLLDVTDRERADESARKLASIVESSDDAIVSKSLDGIVTSWNAGAKRVFGYSADEMVGRSITTIIPDDRQDEELQILSRLRRGERVDHFETVRCHKDGHLINVSLTISPVRNAEGKIIGASKIARDITERMKAEADLRAGKQRLQDLLAAIPAAIYTTDAEGTITYFNEAAIELSGHRPIVGVDKWCVTWKLYWPDGTPLPHDECPMAIALKEGRVIRNVEAVAERPDGTRVPFIPHPTPLRDSTGRIVGGINMLVDISERKHAETHQRVLLRELNHRVKNNMQILHVLLNSSLRSTQTPEARAVLEDASRRVGAMAAAQHVLYGAPGGASFSAPEFLETICRTAQQTFGDKASIRIVVAEGLLWNDAAAPLALILNELLTNAVKHGLRAEVGEIRVGLTKQDETFELYVEDDGPGFTPSETGRRSSGLGLVQALARQLKGKLQITTAGSTRCALLFSERVDARLSS